jgi:hypothetical protein
MSLYDQGFDDGFAGVPKQSVAPEYLRGYADGEHHYITDEME